MLSMLFVVAALFTLGPYAEAQCLPACLPGGNLKELASKSTSVSSVALLFTGNSRHNDELNFGH